MMSKRLDLKFGQGSSVGFTPAGIAAFTNLRPAAVVRELIQNSLDAAREANERTAFVRFRLTRKNTKTIPGIRSYGKALESAIKTTNNWRVASWQDRLSLLSIRSRVRCPKRHRTFFRFSTTGSASTNAA